MRVAIYTRVSTEDQNADHQERALKDFCTNRGFEVVKVYSDVISGSKSNRPALNEMMIDAYNKHFESVIIWKLDRLGRSLSHLLDIVHKFELWGVNLICTTQAIDTTTPNGKLLFHIFGAVAEFERDLIRERTKAGLKGNVLVGKRGKDKKQRKKGGYILRWNPHIKRKIAEEVNKGAFI